MIEMILYGIGTIYTPGPVNVLGLNQGINQKTKKSIGFFIGIGVGFFLLFILFGFTGELLIKKEYLIYISIVGSLYIFYIAYKVFKSSINIKEQTNTQVLTFKNGFIMEVMNPKASLSALPIATIYFPANGITGIKIVIISFAFSVMACSAPWIYAVIGSYFSSAIKNEKVLKIFNSVMAMVLAYVAFTIFYDHVFLEIQGINAY